MGVSDKSPLFGHAFISEKVLFFMLVVILLMEQLTMFCCNLVFQVFGAQHFESALKS